MKDEVGGHYYAVVNAIRSGRRAPSTVAAGDEPRVNCLQGHKIAAQGLLASVLREEVRCATGPGRELRRIPLPRTPVNRATEKAGAVRSPGSLCASPTLPCMPRPHRPSLGAGSGARGPDSPPRTVPP